MRDDRPRRREDGAPGAGAADGPDADWSLPALRREIESIDHALLTLLARRQRVAEAIGRAKRVNGEPVLDPVREAAVVRRAAEGARARGLDEDAVRALFRQLIAMARAAQAG